MSDAERRQVQALVDRGVWVIGEGGLRDRGRAQLLMKAVRGRAACQSQVVHEDADQREEKDQDNPERLRAPADVRSLDDAVPHDEQNEDAGEQRDSREQIHALQPMRFPTRSRSSTSASDNRVESPARITVGRGELTARSRSGSADAPINAHSHGIDPRSRPNGSPYDVPQSQRS